MAAFMYLHLIIIKPEYRVETAQFQAFTDEGGFDVHVQGNTQWQNVMAIFVLTDGTISPVGDYYRVVFV